MTIAWITIIVSVLVALGGVVVTVVTTLYNRLHTMEEATAGALLSIAALTVKAEPGWASIMEQAKLTALHKPEAKYEHRDRLIKHRMAGSATPEEYAELVGLLKQVIEDPQSSSIDRIDSSAAIILMKAHDDDSAARLAIAALPIVLPPSPPLPETPSLVQRTVQLPPP